MQCDICGKETQLYLTEIEASNLSVCSDCSKFGKVLRKLVSEKREKPKQNVIKQEEESVEEVVENYGSIIKNKREKLGLTQKELATKLAEKESLLQKIETESFEPSIALARKIERILGLKLIEEVKEEQINPIKDKNAVLTIGDLINIKKR
ncbi:MAG: multiprotein bridging factor aMBF1 [Nanoarchaeota archaeon]|nr:multiprotein bridging factor aMBF1 [Nanoarchaeota archaeon]